MGLAFLITSDKLQLLSERKVLKEADYAALLDAGATVEAAQEEAARILEQSRSDARRAVDAGRAEGLERAREEYAQRLAADALATRHQLHALREAMARIVVKAVGQFMADADPALLYEAALLRVEALIRSEPFVTVRVSPEREEDLRHLLGRLRDDAGWELNAAVLADPELPRGGCVLITGSGTLEIGVDAQIEAFRKVVGKVVEHGAALGPAGTAAER
jgi:type III secretion protein L